MKIQTNINAVINTKEKYKCEYKVTNNGLERNTKKLQMQICANTKKIFSSLVPLKLSLEGFDLCSGERRSRSLLPVNVLSNLSGKSIRVVESESLKVGKSLKIGKNRMKLEKSDLISY